MRDITKLEMEGQEIGETLVSTAGVHYFPLLEELNLRKCSQLQKLEGIGKCSNLHTLDLSFTAVESRFAELHRLQPCKALRELDLEHTQIKDKALYSLGTHLCGLTDLNLKGCQSITNDGVAFLSNISALERLNLADCLAVTDVECLAKCTRLVLLDVDVGAKIGGVKPPTQGSVHPLMKKLPQLHMEPQWKFSR